MKNVASIEMKRVANQGTMNVATPNTLLKKMNTAVLNSRFALTLASILSFMLCEKVGTAKALHLFNAMIAGTCAFLFGGYSVAVQLLLIVWFAVSCWQCKKDGWRDHID